jgi:hypothetical protein
MGSERDYQWFKKRIEEAYEFVYAEDRERKKKKEASCV